MAFLFQDQNQGIRNDAPREMRLSRPFSFIRTLTVGLGITPNLLTLLSGEKKALAGLGYFTFTAGGDFHPALRTLTARYERPGELWRMAAASASIFTMGNPHVPMTAQRNSGLNARIPQTSEPGLRSETRSYWN